MAAFDQDIKIGYDQFGKVSVASFEGFHYAHVFVWADKRIAWLKGSAELSEDVIISIINSMLASLKVWYPGKSVICIRMGSFSSNKGKRLVSMLEEAFINPQYTPPGQHAFLGDVEQWWYVLLMPAIIGMRKGKAPRRAWFRAMANACDVECTQAVMLTSDDRTCPYRRANPSFANDVSDLYPFYAPGRFAIDPGQLPNKWV